MSGTSAKKDHLAVVFDKYRPVLVAHAYRMLGSVGEAEDLVQDTWLKWQKHGSEIKSPKAWLLTALTRACIDAMRSARRRREEYVGPWLPEPVIVEESPDQLARMEIAEGLSMALLIALERLSPLERAAFLLRSAFDYDYSEIAAVTGRSEAACRQLVSRARSQIASDRPRFKPDPREHERLLKTFLDAVDEGDPKRLEAILAEDIELISDGGGKRLAALNIIRGVDNVSRFFIRGRQKLGELPEYEIRTVNGTPGLIAYDRGSVDFTLTIESAGGRITAIHVIRNPDKLRHLSAPSP